MRKFLWLVAVVFLALALYFNLSGLVLVSPPVP